MSAVTVFILVILALVAVCVIAYKRRNSNKNAQLLENTIDAYKDKIEEKREQKRVDETKTMDAPLGLIQGKQVTFSDDVMAASLIPGSMFPNIPKTTKVAAVGTLEILGFKVYRSYLGDDSTFLQVIVDDNNSIQEVSLYSKVIETTPDEDGWNFLLNEDDGAIGMSTFNLKAQDGSNVPYNREWPQAVSGIENHVDPIRATETVVDEAGNTYVMDLHMMGYSRIINNTSKELMIAQAYRMDNDGNNIAGCDCYVGIEIEDPSSLSVI